MTINTPWFANYEQGAPREVEIPDKLVQDMLSDSARRFPNNTAVRLVLKYLPLGLSISSRMTYKELDAAANRFAAALQKLGVQKNDRVAIMLPNLPQQVYVYFGTLRAGATLVNVNPTYPAPELKNVLLDSEAKVLITLSGLVERWQTIADQVSVQDVIVTDIPNTLGWPFKRLVEKQVRAGGMMKDIAIGGKVHALADLMASAPERPSAVQVVPEDVALFQYTGGTTGVPKAAMLTHRNLVANCMQMDGWFRQIEYGKEKVLCALPIFHVYGMTVGLLFGILAGGELVLVADPRNTSHVIEVISHEKISLYPGVPAMYIGIINHPKAKEFDLRSIKACLSGGSALPVEVAQQFEAMTGGRLVEGFGMTECSPVAAANPIYGQSRIGSIGLPVANTTCAICALEPDENGKFPLLEQGEEGELILRGPQVMKGYWKMPEETAKTIDDEGWLHTGDIARMDEDGYFYIVDRKKDLIIASGFNIVPREVEEVLFQFPKVMDAAVAGVPDPKRGETVKAFIVLKEGQTATVDEIRAFCKERLAPYKVPTSVEFMKELPKTQAGKVLRRELVKAEKEKMEKEAANS